MFQRKIVVLILLLLTFFHAECQMIINLEGNAFSQTPFFNSSFIASNKIKKLKGFYSVTSPTTSVIQTGLYSVYEFDEKGRLIHTLETFQGTERKDSLENFYFYNEQNLLIEHRRKELNGYTSIHNHYDDKNRIVKQTLKRDILNSKNEVDETFIINEETMRYEQSELEEKQTVYNSYNLPYQELTKKFNSNKYLLELTERSLTTTGFYRTTFEYDEHGWLDLKKKFYGSDTSAVETWKYKYDKFGNLTNIYFYSMNELKEEKEIYYNEKSLLLSNMLVIDPKTKRVKILQFKEKSFYK